MQEKNKLNVRFAIEIKNVYHVMGQGSTHARTVMVTGNVQNVMMDGILVTSAMEKELWIALIAMVLAIMLILHVINVEEVAIMIIIITRCVDHVAALADS